MQSKDRILTDVLFVHIPKTGGTSISHTLGPFGMSCYYSPEEYNNFDNKGAVTFGHASVNSLILRGILKQDFMNRSFKFCFVRNPYERVVSSYYAMNFHKRELHSQMCPLGTTRTFSEFCMMLKERKTEPIGFYNVNGMSQLNPQMRWFEELSWDFVGSFEKLNEDFESLCEKLNIDRIFLKHLQKDDNTTKRIKGDHQYREMYDDRSKRIIAEIYAEDIDHFKFDF